jgi:hypothetical protein
MWVSKKKHRDELSKQREFYWKELDEKDQDHRINELKKEIKEIRKLVKQLKKNIGEY